jgi:hypothetical protein
MLDYGRGTPIATLLAHVVYGAIVEASPRSRDR